MEMHLLSNERNTHTHKKNERMWLFTRRKKSNVHRVYNDNNSPEKHWTQIKCKVDFTNHDQGFALFAIFIANNSCVLQPLFSLCFCVLFRFNFHFELSVDSFIRLSCCLYVCCGFFNPFSSMRVCTVTEDVVSISGCLKYYCLEYVLIDASRKRKLTHDCSMSLHNIKRFFLLSAYLVDSTVIRCVCMSTQREKKKVSHGLLHDFVELVIRTNGWNGWNCLQRKEKTKTNIKKEWRYKNKRNHEKTVGKPL